MAKGLQTEIENKLAAARTRLILEKPFLGALTLRLPLVAANPKWCTTAATDARALYYNREYIRALDIGETQFVLAKHALHCALSHFARRQQRIPRFWDLACDYAVNPLLMADGLKPPHGTLNDDRYIGMTAEEIYPLLEDVDEEDAETEKQEEDRSQNRTSEAVGEQAETESGSDSESDTGDNQEESIEETPDSGGSAELPHDADIEEGRSDGAQSVDDAQSQDQDLASMPPELTLPEREQLSAQWQQRLAGAAQTAIQTGKLSGAMARMVEYMRQPKLPWRALLAHYMTASARDDYAYSRPSSRRGDTAIFPSLRSSQVNIAVGVDISGSVKADEMNEFLSEVDAIKGNIRARVILLPCDNVLTPDAPWIFEPWEEARLPGELRGGGGTSFLPVFDWLDAQDQAPDLLVYFTDAKGRFPRVIPNYPVIWLVKGKERVPWGQRVQLN